MKTRRYRKKNKKTVKKYTRRTKIRRQLTFKKNLKAGKMESRNNRDSKVETNPDINRMTEQDLRRIQQEDEERQRLERMRTEEEARRQFQEHSRRMHDAELRRIESPFNELRAEDQDPNDTNTALDYLMRYNIYSPSR